MRRIIVYIILAAVALLVPVKRNDLGKMKPVEVVYLNMEDDHLIIMADTGDWGGGADVQEALHELKETAAGIIYLDTADYLLLSSGTERFMQDLSYYLKDDVRICLAEGEVDLRDAGYYLKVHEPQSRMCDWKDGHRLEILTVEEGGRMVLK